MPRKLDLETLANIADLVDFYCLHDAVELFSTIWYDVLLSTAAIPSTLTEDLHHWTSISWVFRREEDFRKCIKLFLMQMEAEVDFQVLLVPLSLSSMPTSI